MLCFCPMHIKFIQEYKATFSGAVRSKIISVAETVTDQKLKTLILDYGIGYHHVSWTILWCYRVQF